MDITCYENIIGLSRNACECNPAPVGAETSFSNLFLDELDGLEGLLGLENCENGNVWEIMSKAREQATIAFIADTNALLIRGNKQKRQAWKGAIGEAKARDVMNPKKLFAGMRIYSHRIRGGKMKIKEIGALFEADGVVDVHLYTACGEHVRSWSINTEARKHTSIAVDLELDLSHEYCDSQQYILGFEVDKNNRPMLNKVHCGCGGYNPQWSCEKPYCTPSVANSSRGRQWSQWIMAGAWEGDNFEDCDCNTPSGNYMNGLTMKVEFSCNVGTTLCKDEINMDNPLSLSMAFAIRYKAGEMLIRKLLASTQIIREVQVKRETLYNLLKEYQAKYNEHVSYIASEADIGASDCLVCDNQFGLQVSGLLS